MQIQVSSDISLYFEKPTAVVLMLYLHPEIAFKSGGTEMLAVEPRVPVYEYRDVYGNRCGRVFMPAGDATFRHAATVQDHGLPDLQAPNAYQSSVQELPSETLLFLLPSRYCEVDSELKDISWSLFGSLPAGWPLVQAVCNFANRHIRFDYMQARSNRTALDVYRERVGVCRDYMHLAITMCRCLNVPARYCTGYLGDIGVPPVAAEMDFSAWFEVYLGGMWHAFDARNNIPRIGRILMARGRDAADVALTTTFGTNQLRSFKVETIEVGNPN